MAGAETDRHGSSDTTSSLTKSHQEVSLAPQPSLDGTSDEDRRPVWGKLPGVDFEPIPHLEIRGFRLATADEIGPGATSGDAFVLTADGRTLDLWWRSERPGRSARWAPPPSATGAGVIAVEITERVNSDRDLEPVLEAAAALIEQPLAAWGEPHP